MLGHGMVAAALTGNGHVRSLTVNDEVEVEELFQLTVRVWLVSLSC
jgi:DNA-binding protein YbaB